MKNLYFLLDSSKQNLKVHKLVELVMHIIDSINNEIVFLMLTFMKIKLWNWAYGACHSHIHKFFTLHNFLFAITIHNWTGTRIHYSVEG